MLRLIFPHIPSAVINGVYYGIILISIGVSCYLSYRRLLVLYDKKKVQIYMLLAFLITYPSGLISSHAVTMFYKPRHLWSMKFFIEQWQTGSYETFHTCLILPIILLWVMMLIMKFNPWEVFDIFFIYIPLAHVIGRIACLLIGCCWGNPVSLTLFGRVYHFDNPIPLYELLFNMTIVLFLRQVYRKIYSSESSRKFKGLIIALYLILYGIVRMTLEIFRKEPVIAWGMTQAQIAMIIYIAIGLFIMSRIMLRMKAKSEYEPGMSSV